MNDVRENFQRQIVRQKEIYTGVQMKLSMKRLRFKDKQITGNVGLYLICYKLSRRGWNVLPTSRNAKGIDILAYGNNSEKILTIQAKGYTRIEAIGPFIKNADPIADFYMAACFVYQEPKIYVLTKEEVKGRLKLHDEKYWLERVDYEKPEFLENWEKIGYGFADPEETKQLIKIDDEFKKRHRDP